MSQSQPVVMETKTFFVQSILLNKQYKRHNGSSKKLFIFDGAFNMNGFLLQSLMLYQTMANLKSKQKNLSITLGKHYSCNNTIHYGKRLKVWTFKANRQAGIQINREKKLKYLSCQNKHSSAVQHLGSQKCYASPVKSLECKYQT